ncbi:MAG: DDE-type integrase/transposase/recombinase [Deltaproteobacteria bacterium]|nr:DDE-type integrase/transposase/recombinase [Deltaproteobacteria bacterium]
MVERGVGKKRVYESEVKQAVLEEADRRTIVAAAESWGIPPGTVAYWHHLRRRRAEKDGEGRPPIAAGSGAAGGGGGKGPGGRVRRPGKGHRYSPSEIAGILEYREQHGYGATCREFGPCRATVKRWERQADRAAAGQGAAPTGGPGVGTIEEQRDREVLTEWQRHPGLGPSQICNQLRRKGIKSSVNTVRRVMEEAGYRPPKVKSANHDRRYEAVRPNQLWHLDFVQRFINRASTFTLVILDDFSRFAVGYEVADSEQAEVVIGAFEGAVQRYGKPESVMSDKGSAFWSWKGVSRFTALLTELGIDQIIAQDKEHNGKSEIFNANLAKEFFDQQRFVDVTEMRRRLAAHLHWYNHSRSHHALGGLLVPADRYYGRSDEVVALIESGAGREQGLDTLDLRRRCLELFKVPSTNGHPEVFLMGQKIL